MKHLTAHSLFKPPNGLGAPSLFTPLDDSNSTSASCTAEAHVVSSVGIPSSRGRITVQQIEVIAPSDLPEGFELDVEIEGFEHTVVVPQGGVKEGASFRARIVLEPEDLPLKTDDIPSGAWKDGIWGCRSHPLCHPSLCLSTFCCSIALGQIMTRMHLDWKGAHIGRRPLGWTPFKIMMLVTIAFVFWDNVLSIIILPYVSSTEQAIPRWAITLLAFRGIFRCTFLAYFLFALIRTRAYIRNTYSIRKQRCSGYYDCCLSVLCPCCSIAQMARHTTNYRHSTAACCSETGIASHKSSLVEPSMV